ncbi:MAG: alpha/beta hydrolase [Alphaproteobacteria bacterium]|nr:alpha/beta hydrolase [Alphaproteobacteria bacterium]
MKSLTKSVALVTGVTMPYFELGASGGMPVVFVHGLTDSHLSYGPMIEAMPESYHMFVLTMRGHGDASKPASGYVPENMAADVAAFLDAQGIDRAVIVGHSMGSIVARAFAHAYPGRALGLGLLGAFSSLHANPTVQEVFDAVDALGEEIPDDFAREWQQGSLGTPVPDDFFEMVIAETKKVPARVFRDALAGLMARDRTFTGAGSLVPTLIAWGDKDAFCTRADQDALAKVFENSRLLVYPGIGHAVHWELPVKVATDIAIWLKQVARVNALRAA